MKKILLLVAVCLVCSSLAEAQIFSPFRNREARDFRFGLNISPNAGWFRVETTNLEPSGARIGIAYGLMGELKISQKGNYSLNAEVNINHTGGNVKFDELRYEGKTTPFKDVNYSYRLQHLETPISLKFKTDLVGSVHYFGLFGLKPAFLLSAKSAIEGAPFNDDMVLVNKSDYDKYDGQQVKNGTLEAFKDDVYGFRASLLIGGGVEYPLEGKTALVGGLFWDQGFTGVLKDKQTQARNSYLSLKLGIFF